MSWPWSQLGLPGPADLSQVRRAYAERLKTTHPEDDPEGFQRLHCAYQLASRMARQQHRREEQAGPVPQQLEPERTQEQEDRLYEQLLRGGGGRSQPPREEKEEEDFDFDQLLREEEPSRPGEEQDFDFERLFAEGEAERAEARRRRGEERRRAQEQEIQAHLQKERTRRDQFYQERRDRFDQEQFRWQNTETILHTIDMLFNARADREAWEKFFQSELFQQTKGSLDLIFGLEDFVSTRDLPQEVQLALFRAYGFEKGPSRPELRPLYQMLLGAWQMARAKKKRERLWNFLAIPITLALIYVAAVILMSPLLIVFIVLGLVAVHGLNKGWLKRSPKSLARGQRSSLYVLCALAACAVAAALLMPDALDRIRDRVPGADPREQVCRYLEEDYGEQVRSLYSKTDQNERFNNVFALKSAADHMFLAGPDGERDREAKKWGYTTNYPDMMVLWAMEEFAQAHGLREVDLVNRNQNLESWETSGTYLIVLPFCGAGETITDLGERLEELAREDWYQFSPPGFKLVLCGSQMAGGRLILQEYQSEDGPFDAESVRRLYEESFAHAYCAQLLKECGLDRDFVHDGAEAYVLASGGMAEMKGEMCCKLYGLDAESAVKMEYYVNETASQIYCVPGDFWEDGGKEDDIQFYRLIHREETGGMFHLFYPWITVY